MELEFRGSEMLALLGPVPADLGGSSPCRLTVASLLTGGTQAVLGAKAATGPDTSFRIRATLKLAHTYEGSIVFCIGWWSKSFSPTTIYPR